MKKQDVLSILAELPDDVDVEDLVDRIYLLRKAQTLDNEDELDDIAGEDDILSDLDYHIYVLEKIREGERDIAAGRFISHEELVREMKSWRK